MDHTVHQNISVLFGHISLSGKKTEGGIIFIPSLSLSSQHRKVQAKILKTEFLTNFKTVFMKCKAAFKVEFDFKITIFINFGPNHAWLSKSKVKYNLLMSRSVF